MPMVNFRYARPREHPVAKRKCRVVMRNSRSRSNSHSENDSDYIMGLRKSGASREYDTIDTRFSASTSAMAMALHAQQGRTTERRVQAMEGDEDIQITEGMADRLTNEREEEVKPPPSVASPSAAFSPFSSLASIAETPEGEERGDSEMNLDAAIQADSPAYTSIEFSPPTWNDLTAMSPPSRAFAAYDFSLSPGIALDDLVKGEGAVWHTSPSSNAHSPSMASPSAASSLVQRSGQENNTFGTAEVSISNPSTDFDLWNATPGTLSNHQQPSTALSRVSDGAHLRDFPQTGMEIQDYSTHQSKHDAQAPHMQSSTRRPSRSPQNILNIETYSQQTPHVWKETQDDPIEELSRRMNTAGLYGFLPYEEFSYLSPSQTTRKMVEVRFGTDQGFQSPNGYESIYPSLHRIDDEIDADINAGLRCATQ